jgi:hypothetical protein
MLICRNYSNLELAAMLSWFGKNLNLDAQLGSRLFWDEAAWSIASAFGIFIAMRTGQSIIVLLAAALSFWAWVRSRKNYHAIADIPTAQLSSAPQGLVALFGNGDSLPEYPVLSPLTALPCLWFDYKIEEGDGKSRRVTQQGTSDSPFALKDGALQAMVLPDGARVISKHQQSWQRGDETCTESVLLKDEPIFVLGEFVHDWVESNNNSLDKQSGALLQEWKSDQDALTVRFDSNADGVIDSIEWQAAREQAQQDVLSGKQMPQNTAKQCIRKPTSGGLFIISNYSAQQLATRFRRWSWLHFVVFIMALVVAGRM